LKILLDENLSPRLVERLAERGVYARHVAHLGRAGLSDAALFRYATEGDFVVATINAADFLTLAAGVEMHPGLIVLRVSGLTWREQWAFLEPAIRRCLNDEARGRTLVNTVIEVIGSGKLRQYELPR
jgi:predicted nuclease of predicted toxin-antitoxin system